VATTSQWVEGARLRTLPASISPVLAGTGAAGAADGIVWWKAALALVVAVSLQVGANYANDYSDGIRGTDARRVGPARLVGSGAASPRAVVAAAITAFGVAALAGLVLVATTTWWLLAAGAAAIAGAWFYTGGRHPYGYRALGELAVFVFFGLFAGLGTTYVQLGHLTGPAWIAAVSTGAYACAILVANNLRDIATDAQTGKRTLAVLLGERATRALYVVLVAVASLLGLVAAMAHPWAATSLLALVIAAPAAVRTARGAAGMDLVTVLRDTGRAELAFAVLLGAGLAVG
jgi:1,4-dihydroxy-2-naphthoate octaprenyltransferase